MGRKEKNTQQKNQHDTFDVKSNLKKLGASIDRNSYMGNGTTEDDYTSEHHEGETISSYQDHGFKTTFEIYSLKQDKKLTNVLSSFRDAVDGKINKDVKDVKREFDEKLNYFEENLKDTVNKYVFGGVVAFALILVSVIYILSYEPTLKKVDKIIEDNTIIKDSLKSIQFDLKQKNASF